MGTGRGAVWAGCLACLAVMGCDRGEVAPAGPGGHPARGRTIIPAAPARFEPDPQAIDLIRALDRRLIAAVEYEMEGIVPDYPAVERDTTSFRQRPGAPHGARALITELPTLELDGRQVPFGRKHLRIEKYDDETIDIIVRELVREREFYELEDGTRVEAPPAGTSPEAIESRRLYHITPDGEYTVQSLAEGVEIARTADTGTEILARWVPWVVIEALAARSGSRVERSGDQRIVRVTSGDGKGRTTEATVGDWVDSPLPHPMTLIVTERSANGRVKRTTRFTRSGAPVDG